MPRRSAPLAIRGMPGAGSVLAPRGSRAGRAIAPLGEPVARRREGAIAPRRAAQSAESMPSTNCASGTCGSAWLSATGRLVMWPRMTLTPRASGRERRTASSKPRPASCSAYGQRDVRQALGRRDGHRAGHVGDAVVDDAVDHVGRLGVRRRPRGLDAAALVDRDVDDHRARLHQLAASSRVTSFGARAPGISTAPITRSASCTASSSDERGGDSGVIRPSSIVSR